ncbi:MAG: hypothetical protein RBT45_07260, partial [Acholeplasmataceae bacterium]|nr:hypothetical protein [Acholeplasmataceae bacterium]
LDFFNFTRQKVDYENIDMMYQKFTHTFMTYFNVKLAETVKLFLNNSIIYQEIPAIVRYAMKFGYVNIIEFYENSIENDERKKYYFHYSNIKNLFEEAIATKNKNTIKHYYDLKGEISFEKCFDLLIQTKDIDFIESFRKEFPNKPVGYISYSDEVLVFDTSRTLLQLIKNNDIELLRYSIRFSDQKSLNIALYNTGYEQIEIIKLLINHGAIFSFKDSYSGNEYSFDSMTALLKFLLNKK